MHTTRWGIAAMLLAAAVTLTACSKPHQVRVLRPDVAASPVTTGATPQPRIDDVADNPGSAWPAAKPKPAPAPTDPDKPPRLYFATPQPAMRYLAAAYNRNDLVSLKHVTTPAARTALSAMRKEAVNLRLVDCKPRAGIGDYTCTFRHDYPPAMHKTGEGRAVFVAGPADSVGWYMTVLESCG